MKYLTLVLALVYSSLSAEESLSITPKVEGTGRLYFSGSENGEQLTTVDAEAGAQIRADYKGIAGGKLDFEGRLNTEDTAQLGFGDNAYAYIHILKPFSIDAEVFDLYLQGGRFELDLQEASYVDEDTKDNNWLAGVQPIERDERVNMQLDAKILDMLTVRTAAGFASGNLDLGWSLLLEQSFGAHKLKASLVSAW